jgi:hypothetical protein
MRRIAAALMGLFVIGSAQSGCVRRTITITSQPPNALLWLNGREIGRTPVEVDFLYYGRYDVQLVADGCEPLLTSGEAKPPWWDSIPFDFVAEVLPGERTAEINWHFALQPRNDDPDALIERAREMRELLPEPSAMTPTTQPSS